MPALVTGQGGEKCVVADMGTSSSLPKSCVGLLLAPVVFQMSS